MRRAVSTTVVSGETVTTSFDITDFAGIVIRVTPTRLPEQCGKRAETAALIQRNQPGEFAARLWRPAVAPQAKAILVAYDMMEVDG
jgi:hypothetical protein